MCARPLRLELAGGIYHVTSRGDRREEIYLCKTDRLAWLKIFAEVCNRFNWACHAWCQMTNHYHIVIETAEGNLSQGMRHLNGVYTQTFNRTHGRVGHVFQGRYQSILVDKEAYLLELIRYVTLNPVRAGMVNETENWEWSSYGPMVGTASRPDWLQTDWVLEQFGSTHITAVRSYMEFIRDGVDKPSIWKSLRGQIYLGSEKFAQNMQALAADHLTTTEIPRTQRRPQAKPIEYYRDTIEDPKAAMVAAYVTGAYTMQAIADYFKVHYATVSRALKQSRGE